MKKLVLLLVFALTLALPATAAWFYTATLTSTTLTTTEVFVPNSYRQFTVSVQYGAGATGTIYIERRCPAIGLTSWETVVATTTSWTGNGQNYGTSTWQYRARSALTAGSATIWIDQKN